MNARALRTQHPEMVHRWESPGEQSPGPRAEWVESVISLCGGIEAEESYLEKTDAPVDCRGCGAAVFMREAS